jgi:hypothetical protein
LPLTTLRRAVPALAGAALVTVLAMEHLIEDARASQLAGAQSIPRTATPARADGALRPTAARRPARRLFGRTSVWNKRLSATAALDPTSGALVQALAAEVQRERAAAIGPWIATRNGSTPLYRVGRRQTRVRVRLDRRYLHGGKALQRAFASVPIPPDAQPAAGPDGHMTVWQPSTDRLWEFFGAHRDIDGWHTRWGGAIRRVSESPGYYTPKAWPGATTSWGATASSLPVIGGTVMLSELRAGRIDHALAINVPASRAGVFAWPAQRTDGTGPPTALPEGAHLRLDPTLSVTKLQVPKVTRMIAVAAQRYGLLVRDQTGHGISLFGEDPSRFPSDAYGPHFRGRTPGDLLAHFPWDRLQLLKMHLCTEPPCRRSS